MENKFKSIIALPSRGDNASCVNEEWELNLDKLNYFKFNSSISVQAKARWLEENLLSVLISLKFDAETECARCLKPVPLAISDNLMYLYSLCGVDFNDEKFEAQAQAALALNLDNINLKLDAPVMPVEVEYFERTLDITPQVLESILLLLPSKVLCKEDCAGLCPNCGADLNDGPCACNLNENIDPRFSVLKDLKLD
ncbi:MAG: DUF177 domain-containing protein [Synergistaceae bacterium]|nr:DUF177 domain-containing protein [Synergistaceae bacterium]